MEMSHDPTEKKRHLAAIEGLCHRFPTEKETIPALYNDALSSFPERIAIRAFLSIFVARQVREELERRGVQDQALQ